jgi:hypothetical protein
MTGAKRKQETPAYLVTGHLRADWNGRLHKDQGPEIEASLTPAGPLPRLDRHPRPKVSVLKRDYRVLSQRLRSRVSAEQEQSLYRHERTFGVMNWHRGDGRWVFGRTLSEAIVRVRVRGFLRTCMGATRKGGDPITAKTLQGKGKGPRDWVGNFVLYSISLRILSLFSPDLVTPGFSPFYWIPTVG